MKKLLTVILTLSLMATVFTGCSSSNTDTDKKALLTVSFGSSFIDNRTAAIDATEEVITAAFPDYEHFSAFTSQIIIDVYKDRDNIEYKNVAQQIEAIYKDGYGEVLVVPTHVINGAEYDEMMAALDGYDEKFAEFNVSTPLLTSAADYETVASAMASEFPETDAKTAIVLMGHGTHHHANSAYGSLDYVFKHNGMENVFVGTVEGTPTYEDVLGDLQAGGYEKVILMPMMVVAGDHAHNDMAGDEEDSWKVMFKSEGFDVDYVMQGLGELDAIQQLYVDHAKKALTEEHEG